MPSVDGLHSLKTLKLTPANDYWDPQNQSYEKQEESMTDYKGEVKQRPNQDRKFIAAAVISTMLWPIAMVRAMGNSKIDDPSNTVSLVEWMNDVCVIGWQANN